MGTRGMMALLVALVTAAGWGGCSDPEGDGDGDGDSDGDSDGDGDGDSDGDGDGDGDGDTDGDTDGDSDGDGDGDEGHWRVLAIRSQEEFEAGLPGGEAEQHPHCIARSVSDPDVIYLSHDVAGVWRSDDSGESWHHTLDRGLRVRAGQSIEVDPLDSQRVFFEADNSYDWLAEGHEGVYLSTNGGDDWTLVLQTDTHYDSSLHRLYRHNLAFDPASASATRAERWYAAFHDHQLFRSDDGGASWAAVAELAGHTTVYGIYPHPTDGETLYLASSLGLFVSTTRGSDLAPLGDLPAGAVSSLAIDPTAPLTIYATVRDDGLYRSVDGGTSFTRLREFDAARVFLNPGFPQTLYLVGLSSNTIITHDGGATWIEDMVTEPAPGLGREGSWKGRIAGELSGIVPDRRDRDEAVAYSRATLWRTTDGGHVFADSSTGFTGFAWSWWNDGVAFDLDDPDRFAFFNCDVGMTITTNGGDWFEQRNAQTWDWYAAGQLSWIGTYAGAFQRSPGSQVMVAAVGGYFRAKLMVTADEGRVWELFADQPAERNLFVAFHPDDPSLVYAGGWISHDAGTSFERIDFGEFSGASPAILGMCLTDPDTVYAMEDGRRAILRSDDRGATWREYVRADWSFTVLDSLPTFAADPVDCERVYTIDAAGDVAWYDGAGWTSGGVLALAGGTEYGNFVRSVAVDPVNADVVYAGMSAMGVPCAYRSLDRGATWQDISENRPRVGLGAMAVNPHTRELFTGSAIGTWIYPAPE